MFLQVVLFLSDCIKTRSKWPKGFFWPLDHNLPTCVLNQWFEKLGSGHETPPEAFQMYFRKQIYSTNYF